MASTPAFFAEWNKTCVLLEIPRKIIGSDNSTKIRAELLVKLGPNKFAAFQILPGYKFRIDFKAAKDCKELCLHGIAFRGVHLTPRPAFENVTQVFVDYGPTQLPNEVFSAALAPYGRVLAVKHLPMKGRRSCQALVWCLSCWPSLFHSR